VTRGIKKSVPAASKPRIVTFSQLTPKPWINGRGITRDVGGKVLPGGQVDWLISIAELTEDAAFSHYESCDRIFTLIKGGTVELTVGQAEPVRCTPLIPLHFPGDSPTHCRVIEGPARAFNVFAGRAVKSAQVSVATIVGGHRERLCRHASAIHCVYGKAVIGEHTLTAGDTILDPQVAEIQARDGTVGLVVVEFVSCSGPAPKP
jgi:environmental stress-induced protein Ves